MMYKKILFIFFVLLLIAFFTYLLCNKQPLHNPLTISDSTEVYSELADSTSKVSDSTEVYSELAGSTSKVSSGPCNGNGEKNIGCVEYYLEGKFGSRKILKEPFPEYPKNAIGKIDATIEIKFKFEIDPTGTVDTSTISKDVEVNYKGTVGTSKISKDVELQFKQAAINALRQLRFEALPDSVTQENQTGSIIFIFETN